MPDLLSWRRIELRPNTWHCYITDCINLALSKEPDGWYWGAFDYRTGLRISADPKPYEGRESADADAAAWVRANYPGVLDI